MEDNTARNLLVGNKKNKKNWPTRQGIHTIPRFVCVGLYVHMYVF